MRKQSTLIRAAAPALVVALAFLACSQDLAIPYSEAEPFVGGASGRPSMIAKGGRAGAPTAGAAAGGRFGIPATADSGVAGDAGFSNGGTDSPGTAGSTLGGASGSAGANASAGAPS